MDIFRQDPRSKAIVEAENKKWRTYRTCHFEARAMERVGEPLSQEFMMKEMLAGRMSKADPKSKDKVREYDWTWKGRAYRVMFNVRDKMFVTIMRKEWRA